MSITLLGAGALAGAGSVLGNIFGGLFGRSSQASANRANMQLAQYQYEKNLEQWHRENEYNTPKNQMQRYMDAGLNPNLIYSQGTPGVAASSPQYKAPEIKAYTNYGDLGMSQAVQSYLAYQQTHSNVELAKSQKEVNDAKVISMGVENDFKNAQRASTLLKYNQDKEMFPILKSIQEKSLKKLDSEIDNTVQRTSNLKAEANLIQNQIEEIQSRIGLNRVQAASLAQGIRESAQRILESQSRIPLNEANVRNLEQGIQESIVRTDRGKVALDLDKFKAEFEKRYGTTFGSNERQILVGMIGRIGSKFSNGVKKVASYLGSDKLDRFLEFLLD